jgi:hypothetical protein
VFVGLEIRSDSILAMMAIANLVAAIGAARAAMLQA